MTKLLEKVIAKLKTRPIGEQDSISILNENLIYRLPASFAKRLPQQKRGYVND